MVHAKIYPIQKGLNVITVDMMDRPALKQGLNYWYIRI